MNEHSCQPLPHAKLQLALYLEKPEQKEPENSEGDMTYAFWHTACLQLVNSFTDQAFALRANQEVKRRRAS